MERQWANSYILIIFDAGAFLMRVLQTQTRVRNFLVLVSHTFFGTHISGLHCSVYTVDYVLDVWPNLCNVIGFVM